MKLYDSRLAPNPRRVRVFMAEKGVTDIEVIQVDLMRGEHRTPEYLSKVGIPNAPALELDDGLVITESVAICRYLESVYPEPNMFGRDAKEVAVIEMWMRRAEMLLATPLMMAVRHGHPALAALETQVPEVALNNRMSAERSVKLFDRQLANHPFIAGARVTIADIVAICGVDFSRMVQFEPPETAVNFRRWVESMRARPSAQAGR
jgi:glutathione S-transferase